MNLPFSRLLRPIAIVLIVGSLVACSSPAPIAPPTLSSVARSVTLRSTVPASPAALSPLAGPLVVPGTLAQSKSRWVPVDWSDLPGWHDDALHEAWQAWLHNCERPAPAFVALCVQVNELATADQEWQRQWITERFQPYRIESLQGSADGLLTAYYEPVLEAARERDTGFDIPLYRPPAALGNKPWYTRREIDSSQVAQAALADRVIAWVRDPVEALVLHIQGSGRLRVREVDDSIQLVRVAFAATNNHSYQSVGKWLLEQGLVHDATWPGIHAWTRANPQRVNEMLWANPRYVFFNEEPLDERSAALGPRGAQGVPLTPGRSIAVDRRSIPYGTPVWLVSEGPTARLAKLVMAQDTGSAITGAVRADYFTGWGEEAGELAGRLKQGLYLWALWPK